MINTYTEFLNQKVKLVENQGFDISLDQINNKLFPFQKALIQWAIRKGRCAIFADTGLGKTWVQLEVARLLNVPTLIVAPLAVANQTVREAAKLGIPVNYVRSQAQVKTPIVTTNYELVDRFDINTFQAVVLDECFAPFTSVDIKTIDDKFTRKYIKDIQVGDCIVNAAGIDTVTDIHRREVQYVIRITVNGESIICSPNHPFFTQRGWIGAQDIQPGDSFIQTTEAVRMVRSHVFKENSTAAKRVKVLQSILLSEMADAPAGIFSNGTQSHSGSQTGASTEPMVGIRQSQGRDGDGAYSQSQSHAVARSARKGIPSVKRDAPQTFRAWGQWQSNTGTTEHFAGGTWQWMDSGVCFVTGQTDSWLSYMLQAGLSQSRLKNRYRSGWQLSLCEEGTRPKERCQAGFSRVEGIEVLEQGHPDLEKLRDANGCIYLYDIGATQHPSFSVNGFLTHNSSILKSYDGKTKKKLIELFEDTPYKLCCTATPAPNDITEIANHVEFLGIMSRVEMLSKYFVHDDEGWRLKGHAQDAFYKWMSSWAMMLKLPSDLGFDDNGYVLPELKVEPVLIEGYAKGYAESQGQLFPLGLKGIKGRHLARKETIRDKISVASEILNANDEQWVVWCGLNEEGRALYRATNNAALLEGKDSLDYKINTINHFIDKDIKVLISKTKISGFGLNLQHCRNMMFLGLSDSWESYYQAIRRCWRFGQDHPVNVKIILSDVEQVVLENVMAKERNAVELSTHMVNAMQEHEKEELGLVKVSKNGYHEEIAKARDYTLYLGDCVDWLQKLDTESIDFSVFSPPFLSLYTYSDSERDLGNAHSDEEFFQHFNYFLTQLFRVIKPGRNVAIHVAQVAATLIRDGYIGLKDFRGKVIEDCIKHGFHYHGDITIDKNPQIQAQRTKSKNLLFVQLKKDASWLRPGLADYILIFRKPGENAVPIHPDINNEDWILWAHPVWRDIRESDTLNVQMARSEKDERHICPLQLGVIERCIRLWSNPGEMILSPFAGIGSEGYIALKLGRKFTGIELKDTYYEVAKRNLELALEHRGQERLF